jgi:hypothetical protein
MSNDKFHLIKLQKQERFGDKKQTCTTCKKREGYLISVEHQYYECGYCFRSRKARSRSTNAEQGFYN